MFSRALDLLTFLSFVLFFDWASFTALTYNVVKTFALGPHVSESRRDQEKEGELDSHIPNGGAMDIVCDCSA